MYKYFNIINHLFSHLNIYFTYICKSFIFTFFCQPLNAQNYVIQHGDARPQLVHIRIRVFRFCKLFVTLFYHRKIPFTMVSRSNDLSSYRSTYAAKTLPQRFAPKHLNISQAIVVQSKSKVVDTISLLNSIVSI